MQFLFQGKDISHLVGKKILWSGRVEKVINVVEWKDEFATILKIVKREWNDEFAMLFEDEGGHHVTWSEEELKTRVFKIEELTELDKIHILRERKDKARKNFETEFYQLLKRFPALSLDEKRTIINLYLNDHDPTREKELPTQNG